ncbi:MAG: CotH kinase family protein, partial [Muribaculaceae bacterium]|nr:CotH kinase family protein [Muribaculaceae bacterium]
INVYDEDGNYDDEVISKDLSHKNYFNGSYWLDLNGCEWLEAEGAASIGDKDNPLPLQIKARGNYTRKAFSKKPFKLKLEKKQSMLGLSKSKHFAILAHADDFFGYMRNFTGFNLGKRIGLPWTPWQQPVEVIINGDYRGLYFLTESIRV